MATFILVHGAFHGGWCWRETVVHLRAGGHDVYLRCTDPPLVYMRRFYERTSKVPGWQVMELATGHDAMVMEPEALAQILVDWPRASASLRSARASQPAAPPDRPRWCPRAGWEVRVGRAAASPEGKLVQLAHGHR